MLSFILLSSQPDASEHLSASEKQTEILLDKETIPRKSPKRSHIYKMLRRVFHVHFKDHSSLHVRSFLQAIAKSTIPNRHSSLSLDQPSTSVIGDKAAMQQLNSTVCSQTQTSDSSAVAWSSKSLWSVWGLHHIGGVSLGRSITVLNPPTAYHRRNRPILLPSQSSILHNSATS